MKGFRTTTGVLGVLIAALAFCTPANAHRSPAGCTGTGPQIDFASPAIFQEGYREGDTIPIAAAVTNDEPGACDVSDLNIVLELPPRVEGGPADKVNITPQPEIPAGTESLESSSTAYYVVVLPDDVFDANVNLVWEANLHSGQTDSKVFGTQSGLIRVSRPSSTLKVTPSVTSGSVPLKVEFTYELTNTSPMPADATLAPTGIVSSDLTKPTALVKDENCSPVVYQSGDTGGSIVPTLDPGFPDRTPGTPETWKFTCSKTFTAPGTYSSAATVQGINVADGRPWPTALPVATEVMARGSDLTVDKSHVGDLLAGQTTTYKIVVANNGNVPSSGPVAVIDTLPKSMSRLAMWGSGWDCDLKVLVCARTDPLESGASYPEITLTANVARKPPASITNTATVFNLGDTVDTNNVDEDPGRVRVPGTPTGPPSNRFRVKWTKAKPDGSVAIRVKLPGPGQLVVDDSKSKPDLVRRTAKQVEIQGLKTVKVKPTPALKRRLARSGKPVKLFLRVTFTPRGGLAANQKLKMMVGSG